MLTAIFLITTTVTVLAVTTAEGVATMIAGVAAPIVAQLVKKAFGASGFGALAVTVAASGLVALGAMYAAGEIHSVGDALKQITAVFGIATIAYKIFALAEAQKTS